MYPEFWNPIPVVTNTYSELWRPISNFGIGIQPIQLLIISIITQISSNKGSQSRSENLLGKFIPISIFPMNIL